MKWLLLKIFVISLLAGASDERCFKGEWIYHYQNGVLKDSVLIKSVILNIEKKQQEKRIEDKEFLMNIKPCK